MIPNTENQTEEVEMNGTVGTDTAGILALLKDTSNSNGFFGNGNGNGGFAPWAGPASNAVRTEGVEKTVRLEASCINSVLESLTRTLATDAINKNIADGFGRTSDQVSSAAMRHSDQMYQMARDIDNKFANVTEQNHGIALAMKDQEIRNVERFCTLKAGQATIEAKVDANQKYMELFSENQSLKTQVACGCTTGCTKRCHDHHGRG